MEITNKELAGIYDLLDAGPSNVRRRWRDVWQVFRAILRGTDWPYDGEVLQSARRCISGRDLPLWDVAVGSKLFGHDILAETLHMRRIFWRFCGRTRLLRKGRIALPNTRQDAREGP